MLGCSVCFCLFFESRLFQVVQLFRLSWFLRLFETMLGCYTLFFGCLVCFRLFRAVLDCSSHIGGQQKVATAIYQNLGTSPSEMSKDAVLTVSLVSGIAAGVAAPAASPDSEICFESNLNERLTSL